MFRIRRQRLTATAFLILTASTLTFLEQDPTGNEQIHGLYNIQNILRLGLFFLGSLVLLISTYGITKQQFHRRKAGVSNFLRYDSRILVLLLLFLFSMIANPDFATSRSEVYRSYYFWLEWVIVFFAAYHLFLDRQSVGDVLEKNFVWVVKGVVILCVSAVFVGLVVNRTLAMGLDGRLGGFIVHPNKLAVIAIVGALTFYLYGRRPWNLITAFLLLVVAGATLSRSGVMGGIMSVTVAWVFKSRSSATTMVRVVFGLAVAVLGVAVVPVLADAILDVLARGQSTDTLMSLSGRTYLWITTTDLISRHPVFGTGYYFGPARIWEFIPEQFGQSHWHAPHAHNDILNAALASGLLAGILLAAIYLSLLWYSFRCFSGRLRFLVLAIALTLFAHSMATTVLTDRFKSSGALLALTYMAVLARKNALKQNVGIPKNIQSGSNA